MQGSPTYTYLGEMAGHGLAGTQSQTVLNCLGQVVQQAESHRGCVQLIGHTVPQVLSAAGKLAGKEETVSAVIKQQETHTTIIVETGSYKRKICKYIFTSQ